MKKTLVIALGGNAIKKSNEEETVEEQFRNLKDACECIPEMIRNGYRLVLTYGNGSQAGNLLIQQENTNYLVPTQPLYIVGVMTQGQLGVEAVIDKD